MKTNDVVKLVLPVVAVVVVIESVMVISNLVKKTNPVLDIVPTPAAEVSNGGINPMVTVVPQPAQADLVFEVAQPAMKVGKATTVGLNIVAKRDLQVDTLDLYIKYDPTAFDIASTSIKQGSGLPRPIFAKASTKTGLVVANFLIEAPKGVSVKSGAVFSLLNFTVKPKKVGNFEFEIDTGNVRRESATMIVENGVGKAIPYSSNKLVVSVSK